MSIRGRFMIRRVIQMGLVIRPKMAMPKVIKDARPHPRWPNCSVSFYEMYFKLKKFLDYWANWTTSLAFIVCICLLFIY